MDRQINIMDILKMCLKRWYYIVIALVIGAVAAGLFTKFFVTPMYTSYGLLFTENNVIDRDVTEVNLSEMMARKELVPTYAEVLSSRTFLNSVAEEVKLGYTGSNILGMLSMTSKNETEILVISVTSSDPEHSYAIANAIITKAPDFVNEIVKGGSAKVLDVPTYPNKPSSPNVSRNIQLGAIAGVIISLILILIIELLDNKVKDSDTIVEMFKYPILGEIPYFTTASKKVAKPKRKDKKVKA